jgi:hypothetical protein
LEPDEDEADDDINYKSKDKIIKNQLKDFIEDDLNLLDDDDDEDYNEFENSLEEISDKFKTKLDQQNESIYLREILNYIGQTKPDYFNYLMNLLSEEQKKDMTIIFEKALSRENAHKIN